MFYEPVYYVTVERSTNRMELVDQEGRHWIALAHEAPYDQKGPTRRKEDRSILLRIDADEVRFYLGEPSDGIRHGDRVSFKRDGMWWKITQGESNRENFYTVVLEMIRATSLKTE